MMMKLILLCTFHAIYALHEDAYLKTPQLIKKYGYTCETHDITTEDGYILTNFRIPHGKLNKTKLQPIPVLLHHGFLGTSDHWVMTSTDTLSYRLADDGYDVWLMNTRGSEHALKHTRLNQEIDQEFWNYSLHEVGIYDLAATIDYVLNLTNNKQLFHIGQSQGTTSLYVLLSEKPEYNNKIISHVGYTPVAFLNHAKSPLLRTLANIERNRGLTTLRSVIGDLNVSPMFDAIRYEVASSCVNDSPTYPFCLQFFESFVGSSKQLNSTMLSIIFGHIFISSSLKQCIHYIQLHLSGLFQQYDYGVQINMQKYGTQKPPEYNFKNILVPMHIYYGSNDALVNPIDAVKTSNMMPNLQQLVEMPGWSHVDFYFGDDVGNKLYAPTLAILKQYNSFNQII